MASGGQVGHRGQHQSQAPANHQLAPDRAILASFEVGFRQNWLCPQSGFQSNGSSLARWCRCSKSLSGELDFAAAGEAGRYTAEGARKQGKS